MSEEFKRLPEFVDGAPVRRKSNVEDPDIQGRILQWDPSDAEYLVLILDPESGIYTAEEWWDAEDFEIDPDPIPWPGEKPKPVGVFAQHKPDGVRLFATIGDLVDIFGEPFRHLALECVSEPGEVLEIGDVAISYEIIEGGGTHARERRASSSEAST